MKGFKGFTKDLKCRDKQYALGQTYEEPKADLCKTGMHFCEHPLDCFSYYEPADSRYCEVDADDVSDKTDNDTKRVCKKMTIGVELSIKGIVDAAVKFVFDRADWTKKENHATGYQGAAAATGYQGAAAATGYQGAASATGVRGAASATGDKGAASATGDHGAAAATGDQGAASATGVRGAASATGDKGAASATGDKGAASATGYQGAAAATGDQTIAHADGISSKASGSVGNWITLSEWKETNDKWKRIGCKAFHIDGTIIKADTMYSLIDGEASEA